MNHTARGITNRVSNSAVPQQQPAADRVIGTVIVHGDPPHEALLIGIDPPADRHVIAAGDLIARSGIRFLGKPHLSIVPGLVAVDYGTFLTGEAAWEFLTKRSNLYPRAEVFGFRSDGVEDMRYVKTLDFALQYEVLIYDSPLATVPIAKPTALIAPSDHEIAPRLTQSLSRFTTLAAWESAL